MSRSSDRRQFANDTYESFEEFDEEDDERELECKRCGSTDVRWRQQGGKWVLFSLKPGVAHTCELKADDFEDLT